MQLKSLANKVLIEVSNGVVATAVAPGAAGACNAVPTITLSAVTGAAKSPGDATDISCDLTTGGTCTYTSASGN
jgi:hypothetical protein